MADSQDGLTPEQQRLFDEHLDLVELIAKQKHPKLCRYLTMEELLQEGRTALWEAVQAFDPGRGWKLTTFARHRIRGAMYNAYAKRASEEERIKALTRKAGHDFQATQARPGDVMLDVDGKAEDRALGYGELMVASMFAGSIGAYKAATPEVALSMHRSFRRGNAALERALVILPDRDRRLVELRYFEGVPLEAIARLLRISEAGAYRQHDRIMDRLKRLLEVAGVTELPPREDEL